MKVGARDTFYCTITIVSRVYYGTQSDRIQLSRALSIQNQLLHCRDSRRDQTRQLIIQGLLFPSYGDGFPRKTAGIDCIINVGDQVLGRETRRENEFASATSFFVRLLRIPNKKETKRPNNHVRDPNNQNSAVDVQFAVINHPRNMHKQ
jgi:hypothetical protein